MHKINSFYLKKCRLPSFTFSLLMPKPKTRLIRKMAIFCCFCCLGALRFCVRALATVERIVPVSIGSFRTFGAYLPQNLQPKRRRIVSLTNWFFGSCFTGGIVDGHSAFVDLRRQGVFLFVWNLQKQFKQIDDSICFTFGVSWTDASIYCWSWKYMEKGLCHEYKISSQKFWEKFLK